MNRTDNLLTLLSACASRQETIVQLVIDETKDSEGYQLLQSYDQYTTFTERARELIMQISAFNRAKTDRSESTSADPSITERTGTVIDTYEKAVKWKRKAARLSAQFKEMIEASEQQLEANRYKIDLIDNHKLEDMRIQKTGAGKVLGLIVDHPGTEPAMVLRNYLRKNKDVEVSAAYADLRSAEQAKSDESRSGILMFLLCVGLEVIWAIVAYFLPGNYYVWGDEIFFWLFGVILTIGFFTEWSLDGCLTNIGALIVGWGILWAVTYFFLGVFTYLGIAILLLPLSFLIHAMIWPFPETQTEQNDSK
ncbi:hypothetical protein [Brevibacillus dissolubilis]|uniref:hypothetical protein n=1 Tax=Brevibacillus dissolubilis TaxID=1844116 RepID=UPI00111686EC|nr:hypothetical protein [Brevibacillus dissolubilis]